MVVTAFGIQKALYESFNVEDIGSITNGIALFEVAGTAHLAEMTESNWQELHTPRVLGKDRFAQAVKLYRCGAPIDYLIYQPGHPLEPSDLLQQDVAIKDLLTVARKHPVAYLMHRGCSVLRLLGVRGEEESPFLDIWPNQFGIRASSLWPGAHRAVLGWEWRSTQYAALRWPFHHYLFLIASGLVSLLAVSRLNFPNKHLVYCLFVAGVAVLFPLLIVTPASDWRYLMPADVCWVCSTLIGVGDGLLLMDQSHGAGRDQALRTVGNRSN